MSSSNANLTAAVNDVRWSMSVFIQVWSFFFFIFGIIGHALSIYVFTRRKFRRNPCARYFLASTLSGYALICFNIPLRLLQLTYNIDVFISSLTMCRFLTYLLVCTRVLPYWFIALASIDRFLCSSSSATLRGWSSIRVVSLTIPSTVLFIALAYIYIPFTYTILLPQRSCFFSTSTAQAFSAIWNLFFWSWIPTGCMLVFGLLIIKNIRQGKRRVAPQNQLQNNQKKTDRQLIQMLFIQSFVLGSTTMTVSAYSLYVSITNNLRVKNSLEMVIDTFVTNAVGYGAFIGPCMSFYIFTLSSQLFRHELVNLFRRGFQIRIANNPTTDMAS